MPSKPLSPPPLSEGNRLQRRYARWAAPHYAAMAPELREQAETIDRFLYSRSGLGVWLGALGVVAGSAWALFGFGMPWAMALGVSALVWFGLAFAILGAWLVPQRFSRPGAVGKLAALTGSGVVTGALTGFVVGHYARHGSIDLALLWQEMVNKLDVLLPALVLTSGALGLAMWAISRLRLRMLQRELARVGVERERDAAALAATAAQLKLLQAQIQPHFLFNTLSALQHWVDNGDARAPGLLRELTEFLRGSTEMLLREQVMLADEARMARHYLAIMQARLGERLRYDVQVEGDVGARTLPPGLLLTLVENAVEHGISPTVHGGMVQVRASSTPDGWQLSVCDDGAGLAPGPAPQGVGLANSHGRIAHHFQGRARLELLPQARGTCARLTVQSSHPP